MVTIDELFDVSGDEMLLLRYFDRNEINCSRSLSEREK
jgi:hypothetical protein